MKRQKKFIHGRISEEETGSKNPETASHVARGVDSVSALLTAVFYL